MQPCLAHRSQGGGIACVTHIRKVQACLLDQSSACMAVLVQVSYLLDREPSDHIDILPFATAFQALAECPVASGRLLSHSLETAALSKRLALHLVDSLALVYVVP